MTSIKKSLILRYFTFAASVALFVILSSFCTPNVKADLGLQGIDIPNELKQRIIINQKDFSDRIEHARSSKNIDEVKKLFCLDNADKHAVEMHNMLFEGIKNSYGIPFYFKELPNKFENYIEQFGKKYKTTLPQKALIGIFELNLQKDNFSMKINFPVGEHNGLLCFSPFAVLVE